jgi:hypothetical protein
MKNHKLFQIIEKLTRKKFLAFCSYSTKMHNENCDENQLLAYLNKISPQFEEKKLDKETAFKKAFKQSSFDEKRMNNAIAELGKRLQDYLLFQHVKNASFEKEYAMLKVYEELKADNLIKKQIKKLNLTLGKSQTKDTWYYINKIKIAHENYYNPFLERISLEGEKVEKLLTDIDDFYILSKLKYACEVLGRTQVVKEDEIEIKLLEEVLQSDPSSISILHALYHLAFKMIKHRDDSYFFKLKEEILLNSTLINHQDQYILLAYLSNHCAFRFKEGNISFRPPAFEIYKFRLENNFLITNGYFDENQFTNIVDLATSFGKISWAKIFMKEWKTHLTESHYNDVVSLCEGIVLFREKQYDSALSIFCGSYKKNSSSDIRARLLRIACKYEKERHNDIEHVLRECANLETYISREAIAHPTTKKSVLAYVKIIKKLLNISNDKAKILSALNNYKHILYKSWLLEKIEELKR